MGVSTESDDGSCSSSSESPSNSRPATPQEGTVGGEGSALNEAAPSPAGSVSSSSSSSNSSSSSSRSDRSKAKKKSSSSSSGSDSSGSSSSSSSDEDDNDNKRISTVDAAVVPNSKTGDEDAKIIAQAEPISPSPNKSQPRSPVRSRSNSPEQIYNQAGVDLNISHEDLSDVSDIDMEKPPPPSSKDTRNANDRVDDENDSDDDDDEEGAISSDSLPPVSESPTLNGKSRKSPKDTNSDNKSLGKETKVRKRKIRKIFK